MTGITGITYCHNAIERDYCLEACISSMQPVCDEIIVVDCESTDGTQAMVDRMDKVRRIELPFSLKEDGARWLLKCINAGRMAAKSPFIFQLDADEVLFEGDYDVVKEHVYSGRPALCWRHNFWVSSNFELPEGRVVGSSVVRLAPQSYWMPSDEPRTPEPPIRMHAIPPVVKDRKIRIFHYGFLRDLKAFVIKGKAMTEGYFGTPDMRIEKLLTEGARAFDQFVDPKELIPYKGPHPEVIRDWLSKRGHFV